MVTKRRDVCRRETPQPAAEARAPGGRGESPRRQRRELPAVPADGAGAAESMRRPMTVTCNKASRQIHQLNGVYLCVRHTEKVKR